MLTKKSLILAIDDEQLCLNELKYEFAGKDLELKTFLGPNAFEAHVVFKKIWRSSNAGNR